MSVTRGECGGPSYNAKQEALRVQALPAPLPQNPDHNFQQLKTVGVRENQQNHGTQGKALTEILT